MKIELDKNVISRIVADALLRPFDHVKDMMMRYWVSSPHDIGGEIFTARINKIYASDPGSELYDYPWDWMSLILDGGYWDVTHYDNYEDALDAYNGSSGSGLTYLSTRKKWELTMWYGPGSIISRSAVDCHRIIIPSGGEVTMLTIMGKYRNKWGFQTGEGKVYWRDHLSKEYVAQRSFELNNNYSGPGVIPLIESRMDLAEILVEHDFSESKMSNELISLIRDISSKVVSTKQFEVTI